MWVVAGRAVTENRGADGVFGVRRCGRCLAARPEPAVGVKGRPGDRAGLGRWLDLAREGRDAPRPEIWSHGRGQGRKSPGCSAVTTVSLSSSAL